MFEKGDSVRKANGSMFMNGKIEAIVDRYDEVENKVWFNHGTWLRPSELVKVQSESTDIDKIIYALEHKAEQLELRAKEIRSAIDVIKEMSKEND